MAAKLKYKWVYRVSNPSQGRTDTFASRTVAVAKAKARAKRECGEVAVFRARQSPAGVFNEFVKGTGYVWRGPWRSCTPRRKR